MGDGDDLLKKGKCGVRRGTIKGQPRGRPRGSGGGQ